MAIRVTFHLVDDLDGTASPDVVKVFFGLDGLKYEIDLNAANAERLHSQLAEFVRVARRTGRSPVSPPTLDDLRCAPRSADSGPARIKLASHWPAASEWQLEDWKTA